MLYLCEIKVTQKGYIVKSSEMPVSILNYWATKNKKISFLLGDFSFSGVLYNESDFNPIYFRWQ
jgi:hypothetical protein